MADPRVKRTKTHVLQTVRTMLAGPENTKPLTLTSLAATAQVSRRTLSMHWSGVDSIVADALAEDAAVLTIDRPGLSVEERMRQFLGDIRDELRDSTTRRLFATMVSAAARNPQQATQLRELTAARIDQFCDLVAPISESGYAALVGQIFYAELLTHQPTTDAQLDEICSRSAEHL